MKWEFCIAAEFKDCRNNRRLVRRGRKMLEGSAARDQEGLEAVGWAGDIIYSSIHWNTANKRSPGLL